MGPDSLLKATPTPSPSPGNAGLELVVSSPTGGVQVSLEQGSSPSSEGDSNQIICGDFGETEPHILTPITVPGR